MFAPQIKTDEAAQQRIRNWIAALRSGKYMRADGILHGPEGYCCLGVACDVLDPAGWSAVLLTVDQTHGYGHYLGAHTDTGSQQDGANVYYLSQRTLHQLRLTTQGQRDLAKLNDNGCPFDVIAQRLETELQAALA